MFGVANQMLAAIALAIVSAYLVNEGRGKYLWVTVVPMCVVCVTTTSAALELIGRYWNTYQTQTHLPNPSHALVVNSVISGLLTIAMLVSAYVVILVSMRRCVLGAPAPQERESSAQLIHA
jgi:carbon starvation protein